MKKDFPLFAFETILFERVRLSFAYALHCLGAFGVGYLQCISVQKTEGYSGILQVLKTTQFLWGWQVTAIQAVRQDRWQPDDVTPKKLAQAYQESLTASGLRESNAAEQLFAAVEVVRGFADAFPQQPTAESPSRQAAPAPQSSAKQPPQDETPLALVRGQMLEPQAPETKTPASVVNILVARWGVALLPDSGRVAALAPLATGSGAFVECLTC